MGIFVNHPKNQTLVHQANYVKILRVVPFLRSMHCDSQIFASTRSHQVEINILDVTPYTTSFNFLINYVGSQKWLPQIYMTVRCYHDARVAEVINFQHHKQFDPRYSYPNPNMFQPNEKQQINRFLGEWLNYCMKTGRRFRSGEVSLDA